MADPRRDQRAEDPGTAQREGPPPLLEWVVAAIGLVGVLASMGVLGWHAWRSPAEGAPEPRIEVNRIEPQGGQYLVQLTVRNAGTRAAGDLLVSGELWSQDQRVERSEMRLDHLPAGSLARGGLLFSRDPRGLRLQLRAEGYQQP
ncbi:hypothetical protein JI739_17700 [Ramlibacter sp. AW1]|uniref:TIGR02588 family protein n=1 Tax=Ramlibacter aurantiacus TaxID=2801330 RepID=A0A936ZJR7_9BURK|nr:hypothetical protein [Ramlibacter aurantiacus]MBL0422187.1 hypothetical protein [Ramlibacter aurantiacus]